MHERVVGDSGLDQRPGGPDVKFLSNNKAFEWFAGIISVLKVSNYTLKKNLKIKFKKQSFFQSLSRVQFFATPWTAACQASMSFTIPGVCSNSCPLSR